ncbi:response regulator [Lysobacter sp. CA196]|uniref:response regulator n=1 Tax=Lysobacter sp. CA196 TaxID=3455606 RepID=UPI003F8D2C6F
MEHLVADDHPSMVMAIEGLLKIQCDPKTDTFRSTNNTAELFELISAADPTSTMLILDLVMPGKYKRLPLLQELLRRNPGLRIVAYTSEESPFLATDALSIGVLGYVAKSSRKKTLIDAINQVRDGGTFLDPAIDVESIKKHPWSKLTDRQRWVVIELCKGAPLAEIASVADRDYDTISQHKRKAMTTLGIRGATKLVSYLYENRLAYLLDE